MGGQGNRDAISALFLINPFKHRTLKRGLRKTCYRGGSRHGVGEAGRPGDKPTGQTVRNIDCHDVASVRTSPYRRRVIGPGVVPASLVDDLGGSPKCIRACRLDLRGSYRVFTLCKELGTAAAAREAYDEYMILHRPPI